MNTETVRIRFRDHAQEVLWSMATAYKTTPALLLRVIVESVLDAASEDGNMQSELAEAARYLRRTGHVPNCWLNLEGERYEDGPDDSGLPESEFTSHRDQLERKQNEADYGDDAAKWGERTDNGIACDMLLEMMQNQRKGKRRFASLADAG